MHGSCCTNNLTFFSVATVLALMATAAIPTSSSKDFGIRNSMVTITYHNSKQTLSVSLLLWELQHPLSPNTPIPTSLFDI